MLELFWRFLRSKKPTYHEALWGLRLLFSGAFLLQVVLAGLLGLGLSLIASPVEGPGEALARFLFILALVNLPLGIVMSFLTAWRGGKERALSAAILLGGMLATPAWFLLLVVMAGTDIVYPLRLALLLLLYFPLGFFLAGKWARLALKDKKKP